MNERKDIEYTNQKCRKTIVKPARKGKTRISTNNVENNSRRTMLFHEHNAEYKLF